MNAPSGDRFKIAVVLPCYNEALTIGALVRDFGAALPGARVVVFDNASTDGTAEAAGAAGAEVIRVERRGKGNVVRAMFAEVDAEVYVMADGDGTYAAADAPAMVEALVGRRLDMVVGVRQGVTEDAGRAGHAFGNRAFNWLFRQFFERGISDIFSGYRVFSRRFVKSFPALSTGFEIETELSVHALSMLMPIAELPVAYGKRPEGSFSKLSTIQDGLRILSVLALLIKEVKPFFFFTVASLVTLIAAIAFGAPVVREYFQTGLVDRVPTWVFAMALLILSFLLFACGVILDSVARGRVEQKRLHWLAIPRIAPDEGRPAEARLRD